MMVIMVMMMELHKSSYILFKQKKKESKGRKAHFLIPLPKRSNLKTDLSMKNLIDNDLIYFKIHEIIIKEILFHLFIFYKKERKCTNTFADASINLF